ncbi:uncharacterized protein LOC111594549 [Drosophila hydei]|uniref:Uncharacterized protein LOC111594549 n=1 Tax=Drosophila hydei TaxID=7224 RepID=A0A6J1LAA0_DROHY|nr:uncharacterized protein LOC111594549 [Drosophila hydei]
MLKCVQSNVVIPVRFMASYHSIYGHNLQAYSRSYYDVLKVPLNSSGKEIKQAFFALSKKYHPDGNSGTHDSDEFVKVCEAYRVLYKRASRDHYNNRLRSRYRAIAPVETCYMNKNVHKSWVRYQAAVRHKQFGHDMRFSVSPTLSKNQLVRVRGVRLLPAGKPVPIVSTIDVDAVPLPFFNTQSNERFLSALYLTAFGLVVSLLVLDSVKRCKHTSEKDNRAVSGRRSYKYFSALLSLICNT